MSSVSTSPSSSTPRRGLLSKIFQKPVSTQTHPYPNSRTSARDSGMCLKPVVNSSTAADSNFQRVRSSVLRVTRAHQRRPATLTPFLARSPPHTAGEVRSFPPFLRSLQPLASRGKRRRSNQPQQSKSQLRRPRLHPSLTSLSDGH